MSSRKERALVVGCEGGPISLDATQFTLRDSGNTVYSLVGVVICPLPRVGDLRGGAHSQGNHVTILYGIDSEAWICSGDVTYNMLEHKNGMQFSFVSREKPVSLPSWHDAEILANLTEQVFRGNVDVEPVLLDLRMRWNLPEQLFKFQGQYKPAATKRTML